MYELRNAGSQSPRVHWNTVGRQIGEVLKHVLEGVPVCDSVLDPEA